jgi:hypothetical protein
MSTSEHNARPRRRGRRWLWLGGALVVVALVWLAARLALPSYLQTYVNRVLDQDPRFDGRIGAVDVHLWRGAYSIHELKIVKTTYSVPVPFFEARRVDFSLDWDSLIHGVARGKVVMDVPRLNFVHGPSEEESQTSVDQPWLTMMEDLFPFRIDKAEINRGEIHFHAFHTRPEVNVYLSEVEGEVTNLTNVEDKIDPLLARAQAEGAVMHSGRFEFDMSLDPQSHRPTFTLATRMLDVHVTELNELTRAYGDFDFEAGQFDLVVELSAKDGYVTGYAKPLFRDLQVVSLRDIETDDPLQVFWEALVGMVEVVFRNQPRDQFGTRFALEGRLDNPQADVMEIVGNVLRNAFIRAYLPRLEGRIAPETGSDVSFESE